MDRVDVLEVLTHAVACVRPGVSPEHAEWHRRLVSAKRAVAELIDAMRGVIAVADRNTDEFNRARAALARITKETGHE